MKRSNIATVTWVIIVLTVGGINWQMGRLHERQANEQKLVAQLTSKPLGPETVGFKPLDVLPVLKQIEVSIDGETRKFVVGEIRMFEVKRYGVRQELVLDSWDHPVAEIVRATEMNKTSEFTKPDDCYRSRTCSGMSPMAVYTSAYRDLEYVKAQQFQRDMFGHYDGYVLKR